jgi:ubiquitin carboxyl-terminal hydrolase 7
VLQFHSCLIAHCNQEIKPEMVDAVKLKATFSSAELGDGDIICFQKEISAEEYVH